MARVTVIFEDSPIMDRQLVVRIESDPHFPTRDGGPDLERTTPAQAAAFAAVMEVVGLADTSRLFVIPPAPDG